MSDGLIQPTCPDCGGELTFLEKNSFSGRVFREYWCARCERVITEGGEVALWKQLEDAREAGHMDVPDPAPAAKPPARPWWKFWK